MLTVPMVTWSGQQLAFALEPTVRQEPLKALAGVAGSGRFAGWRGRSGRRYVVSRFAIDDHAALGFEGAVLIAVDREGRPLAALSREHGMDEVVLRGWRDAVILAGAVELHLHLVAATEAERATAVADLAPRAN